jgi:hypothetical protein
VELPEEALASSDEQVEGLHGRLEAQAGEAAPEDVTGQESEVMPPPAETVPLVEEIESRVRRPAPEPLSAEPPQPSSRRDLPTWAPIARTVEEAERAAGRSVWRSLNELAES